MNEDHENNPKSPDLGETLVRRATDPGVIRRSLATNGPGSCCVADGGRLAAQIQRRFAPAGSADSGGSALPLTPVTTPLLSSAMGTGAPSPSLSASPRVARATALPTVQGSVVERKEEVAGPALVQRSVVSPMAPAEPGLPVRRMGAPGEEKQEAPVAQAPAVQASVVARSVEMGPAIVRRSLGAPGAPDRPGLPLRRMSAPEEEAPASAVQMPAEQASVQARSVARAALGGPAPPARPHPPTPSPIAPPATGRGGATAQRTELARVGGSPSPGGRGGDGRGGQGVRSKAASATESSSALLAPTAQASPARTVQASPPPASPLLQRAQPEAGGQALPLARSVQPAPAGGGVSGGGEVRRQMAAGETVMASPAMPLPGAPSGAATSVPAVAGGPGAGATAGGLSIDDVVEQVMRRLSRSLTVENERHGGRRWP